MKEVKIEIPKGYEIDKEKSTFEKIVFKEVKNELPKSWEELGEITGYYVDGYSAPCTSNYLHSATNNNKNVFATKEQAEASIALAQLSQLMKVYNGDWVADWTNMNQNKYCIYLWRGKIDIEDIIHTGTFLSFKDAQTRDLFLENFRDLIEKAKPLMS